MKKIALLLPIILLAGCVTSKPASGPDWVEYHKAEIGTLYVDKNTKPVTQEGVGLIRSTLLVNYGQREEGLLSGAFTVLVDCKNKMLNSTEFIGYDEANASGKVLEEFVNPEQKFEPISDLLGGDEIYTIVCTQ